MDSYYAVIFTNVQTADSKGYAEMALKMEELARQQPGFVDFEHAREELAITISYWRTLEDISNWKANLDHLEAQKLGKQQWYEWYKVRICKVKREYVFTKRNS